MFGSRRLFTALTAGGLFVAASAAQGSNFALDQYFAVSDSAFFGSQNIIYNYVTTEVFVTPYAAGDYFFYYSLPFGADLGLFHYSYLDGRYTEAVYLNDYAL